MAETYDYDSDCVRSRIGNSAARIRDGVNALDVQLDEALTYVERLEAELAEARKDGERLEWRVRNPHLVLLMRPKGKWSVWNRDTNTVITEACNSSTAAIDGRTTTLGTLC